MAVSKQMLPSVYVQISMQATERTALMLQKSAKGMALPIILRTYSTYEADP